VTRDQAAWREYLRGDVFLWHVDGGRLTVGKHGYPPSSEYDYDFVFQDRDLEIPGEKGPRLHAALRRFWRALKG